MKRRGVAIVFLIVAPSLAAAVNRQAWNSLSVELIEPVAHCVGMLWGSPMLSIPVNLEYQRILSEHFVLVAKVGLVYSWPAPNAPADSPVMTSLYGPGGWMLSGYPLVELDWHPFHGWLGGLFMGLCADLYCSLWHAEAPAVAGDSYSYCAAVGPTLGWRFLLSARTFMELVWGYGCNYLVYTGVDGTTKAELGFGTVRAGLSVGVSF